MTDKKHQIKNSLIYIFPLLLGSLIPILTMPIYTRILTREDFGVYALAQVYAIFISGIANFGLTTGYERNFFQYEDLKDKSSLLYSTLVFVFFFLILFIFLTYLLRGYLAKLVIRSPIYGDILFWSLCSVGISGLKNYFMIYFKNTENAKAFAGYTIKELFLNAVLTIFLVAYLKIGVIGLVWGQLLASLVIFVMLSYKFLKIYPFIFNWQILRDSLKISYPLTPRIFLGIIGNQFDKYMIGLMSTIGGVGIYSIGQKISNSVFTFMTAVQNVYSPQVYKKMFALGEKGGKDIGSYLTPFAYFSVFFALIISFFSEEGLILLIPESYHGAIDIIIILSMFYSILFFGKQPQLIYAKKTYMTSVLSIISIALNILINIPFIIKWGAIGAAWGTLLAGLISGSIAFYISQHYYEIKWEYKKIGCIFLFFFIAAILLIIMRNTGIEYIFRLIFKIVFLFFYLYIGIKFEIINRENYNLFKDIFLKGHAMVINK